MSMRMRMHMRICMCMCMRMRIGMCMTTRGSAVRFSLWQPVKVSIQTSVSNVKDQKQTTFSDNVCNTQTYNDRFEWPMSQAKMRNIIMLASPKNTLLLDSSRLITKTAEHDKDCRGEGGGNVPPACV